MTHFKPTDWWQFLIKAREQGIIGHYDSDKFEVLSSVKGAITLIRRTKHIDTTVTIYQSSSKQYRMIMYSNIRPLSGYKRGYRTFRSQKDILAVLSQELRRIQKNFN